MTFVINQSQGMLLKLKQECMLRSGIRLENFPKFQTDNEIKGDEKNQVRLNINIKSWDKSK